MIEQGKMADMLEEITGVRFMTQEELEQYLSAKERAGIDGKPVDLSSVIIIDEKPTPDELIKVMKDMGFDDNFISILQQNDILNKFLNNIDALALPDGRIFMPNNNYQNIGDPDLQNQLRALLAHETHHITQYFNGEYGSTNTVFAKLLLEGLQNLDYWNIINLNNLGLNNWIYSIDPKFNPNVKVNPYFVRGYLEFDARRVQRELYDFLNQINQHQGEPVLFGGR